MATEEEDQDTYVAQLREVFDSCDGSGLGYLNREELVELCVKLQLEDQTDALVEQLMGKEDGRARVGFEEFKEGFVAVLSETVDGLDSTDDELDEEEGEGQGTNTPSQDGRLTPKIVHGEKRYGRWSRQHADKDVWIETNGYIDGDGAGEGREDRASTLRLDQDHSPSLSYATDPSPIHGIDQADLDSETYEAEGQLNKSMSNLEHALDPVSEEQHLRQIWRELGVGADGALTLTELDRVCQHIGMEQMSSEEMQELYDKLDVDHDGRVTFQEFLQGLFQHGAHSAGSTPVCRTLSSTPRQHKLRLTPSSSSLLEDRTHTPSYFGSGSGVFSTLDVDNSGFAKPETITELWDNLGIPTGAVILEYLQFELDTKVSLAELSYALEQEMHSVEEDNATYQAALASYEYELKHLKTANDHLTLEKEKLRSDLAEAHSRISLLVKEGDERHSSLERSRDKELQSLEKRYQDQMKALQAQLESERESLSHQAGKQRKTMQTEMDRLREEEGRLRDKLTNTQKELEKLEHELVEMMERCADLERVNERNQQDLLSAAQLQQQLEDMESHRDSVLDEQNKFSQQKLQSVQTENKDLKDRNDELTLEVESLRQQLSASRRQKRVHKGQEGGSRHGSVVSDYIKPTVTVRDKEAESEDDASSSITSERIPQPELQSQLAELQREHAELERALTLERKDVEEAYRMEITQLEDSHKREVEELKLNLGKKKKVPTATLR